MFIVVVVGRIAFLPDNVQVTKTAYPTRRAWLVDGLAGLHAHSRAGSQSQTASHRFFDMAANTMHDYCECAMHPLLRLVRPLAARVDLFQARPWLQVHSATWSNRRVKHHIYTSSHRDIVVFSHQFCTDSALTPAHLLATPLAPTGTHR